MRRRPRVRRPASEVFVGRDGQEVVQLGGQAQVAEQARCEFEARVLPARGTEVGAQSVEHAGELVHDEFARHRSAVFEARAVSGRMQADLWFFGEGTR